MKKRIIFILSIIIVINFICFYSLFLKNNNKLNYKKVININVGDNIPTSKDYNEIFDSDINWISLPSKEGKVYKTGMYKGTISYNNLNYNVNLLVIDSEPPVISGVKDITTYVESDIDLLKDIIVTDNSNEVNISVIGEYDLNKVGTYNLAYEAKDASGNIKLEKFFLTVKYPETSKGYAIKKVNDVYYINGIIVANKTYSLPSKYNPGGLNKEVMNAFYKMKEDASKLGLNLKIISGYRSYESQRVTYNNYVASRGKSEADFVSARPGHSEHQTGYAIDINSLSQTFQYTEEGKWLNSNAYKYGFILRYPKSKTKITGYMYEPWHFRYIGAEAKNLYNNGNWITLEEYLGITSKY